jgi:hypothetical protein
MVTPFVVWGWTASGCAFFVAEGRASAAPLALSVEGYVEAHGGTFGDWRLDASMLAPVADLQAVDISSANLPGVVLRIASLQPMHPAGVAVIEQMVHRENQVRVADLRASEPKREVLLTRERCGRLDVVLPADGVAGEFAGSVRFNCSFPSEGRLTGAIEIKAVSDEGAVATGTMGHVDDTGASLGVARFSPNRCAADASGVLFWNVASPRILFDARVVPADTRVLGQASNAVLEVTSTEATGHSFVLRPEACRVLRLKQSSEGYSRSGGRWQATRYTGSVTVDCVLANQERLIGTLTFSC